jgi:hypothetical protein
MNPRSPEADSDLLLFVTAGSRHIFFNSLTRRMRDTPECGAKQPEVNLALMEAWDWLQSAGLLVEKARSTGGWFFISHRGKQITTRDDFVAYRKATLLPKTQLEPLITSKVYDWCGERPAEHALWYSVAETRFWPIMDTKTDTKTKGGLGVRFGVHYSTKRARFGGFQRL